MRPAATSDPRPGDPSPSDGARTRRGGHPRANDGERAGAVELALEGLFLARRISKDTAAGETVYG